MRCAIIRTAGSHVTVMCQGIWAKSFDTATLDSERNCEKSTFCPKRGIVLKFEDHSGKCLELETLYENIRLKQNDSRRSRYGKKLVSTGNPN